MTADTIIGLCVILFIILGIMMSLEMGNHARECDRLEELLEQEKLKNQRLTAEAKVFRERYLAAVTGRRIKTKIDDNK